METAVYPSKVVHITNDSGLCYKAWVDYVAIRLKMRGMLRKLASELLYEWMELSKDISDIKLLEEAFNGRKTRLRIMRRMNISKKNFYNMCWELRKLGYITPEGINQIYRPKQNSKDKGVAVMLYFDFGEGDKKE